MQNLTGHDDDTRYFGAMYFDAPRKRCTVSYVKIAQDKIYEHAWRQWKTYSAKKLLDNIARCPVATKCKTIIYDRLSVDRYTQQQILMARNVVPHTMTNYANTKMVRIFNRNHMAQKIILHNDSPAQGQLNVILGKRVDDDIVMPHNPKQKTDYARALLMACLCAVVQNTMQN